MSLDPCYNRGGGVDREGEIVSHFTEGETRAQRINNLSEIIELVSRGARTWIYIF